MRGKTLRACLVTFIPFRAVSSVVEHFVHTEGVTGSNPVLPTIKLVWLYILQSLSTGRFYVGVSDRLEEREVEHGVGQTVSTRNRGPWKLVHKESFIDRPSAMQRERQLKSWKSHRSIAELIKSNE